MSTPTESVIRLRARVMTELAWPRIALVTAVFNSGKYVEQATQLVLAQRYLNLDYFNVDGGSTDGTVEIIRGRVANLRPQRVKHLRNNNGGQASSFNVGFARVQSEFVAI